MTLDNSDNLPIGWRFATLEDVIAMEGIFKDGDWVESKDQDPDGDVRLIQLADIGDGNFKNKSSRFLTGEKAKELNCTFLEKGDVLIARMPDPLGRACLFPLNSRKSYVTVVDVCIVRFGHELIETKYFMHLINSPEMRKEIESYQSGSTRKRISRKNLAKIQFPVPPLNEQKRIVAKIEALFAELDAGVASLELAQAQLQTYRQALLKHAFEGKLTAQWRTANADKLEDAETLLQRIQDERQTRYQAELAAWKEAVNTWEANGKPGKKPSKPNPPKELPPLTPAERADLPQLPAGWAWVKIGEAFGVYVGATPSRKIQNYWDGDISWVSSGEVAFCRIKQTKETITHAGYANSSTDIHPIGTVMLGMIGEGKTRGQAAILDIEAAHNQNTAGIRVSETDCVPEYLYHFLFMQYEITRRIGSGNNQKALNKERVSEIRFPLSPVAEQVKLLEIIDEKLSVVDQLEQTIIVALQQAEALRQSILKKAFAGQLVPQDPTDEPASALLARIRAAKL